MVTDGHAAYRALVHDTGISHEAVKLRAGARVRGAVTGLESRKQKAYCLLQADACSRQ